MTPDTGVSSQSILMGLAKGHTDMETQLCSIFTNAHFPRAQAENATNPEPCCLKQTAPIIMIFRNILICLRVNVWVKHLGA